MKRSRSWEAYKVTSLLRISVPNPQRCPLLAKIFGKEIIAEIGLDLPLSRRPKKKSSLFSFLKLFPQQLFTLTETQVGSFLTKFPNSLHFGPLHKKLEFSSPVCWLHFPEAALWCALSQQTVGDLRETPVWLMALGPPPRHGWERVGAALFCTAWLRKLCLLL